MIKYVGLDASDLQEIYVERRNQFLLDTISERAFRDVLARLGYLPSEVEVEVLAVYEERKRTSDVTAELRDWHKFPMSYGKSIYTGKVYGDTKKRWADGHHIATSYVVKETKDALGNVKIHTLNSVYVCYKKFKYKI